MESSGSSRYSSGKSPLDDLQGAPNSGGSRDFYLGGQLKFDFLELEDRQGAYPGFWILGS